MRVSKTLLLLYGTRHVVERWVRENYAGMGSVVRHTPVHPAYALFGLPSIVTVPLASP